MNDQKTIAELKKLQIQARGINTKLTALMENRRQIADPAIAETRLENFGDDVDTIISDLSHYLEKN